MELGAPALVTLANGENYFRELQIIKNTEIRKTKPAFGSKPSATQPYSAHWIILDLWSRV